ncbi:hypothetical protein [Ottowia sp.]|uniref:hypothetical protein n=1 Tax=Ottowia sp. TaxID=1898956 RepID=UPI0025F6D81C|nr:hypothetical protein [Ottowia sp.]MBK6616783.1 hypothetical protein [Ottowia sp.]
MRIANAILVTGFVAAGWGGSASAQVEEVIIALQPGLAYSAQMIMKDQGYVEASLAAAGLKKPRYLTELLAVEGL